MFNKRSVEYEGLDCMADMNDPKYMQYKHLSQSEVSWESQSNYAKYTVYFGVVIIFISFLKNIYYRYRDYRYVSSVYDGKATNPVVSTIDVLISYCRFVGYKQTPKYLRFWLSFPKSIGSSLFMMISTLYLACYCFVPHFWYRGCAGFGSPPLAVRAGMMSTALVPFIYVLGGKSNIISLLTGISYEKLNVFHQFVGVAAFILGVIHTIPFIYQTLQEGGSSLLNEYFISDSYYISGIPTLILMGLLCILSKAFIRKKVYELFWHLHWMMGIAFFGCLIWHIDNALGAQNYMWGALAFWSTQIIYRILIKTCFKPNTMFLRSREAQLNRIDDNTYEIIIKNVSDYKWKPGQHCYLRFKGLRILDNHPFSISSSNETEDGMRFIIVAKSGITKSQHQLINKTISMKQKVYLDGPYGGTFRDVNKFEKVVLVASGTGVTATIPFLNYLSQQSKKSNILKCVNFIWVVRNEKDINWISDELKRCKEILGSKLQLDIRVVEYEKELKTFDDSSDIEKSMAFKDNLTKEFPISYGKPNITQILSNLTKSLSIRNIFICSGSESMQSQVCEKISEFQSLIFNNDLRNTDIEEIYLHTESFVI
ncbi:FRE7 [Candida pseudojiufengensis]|uniref:FRE7 n=1 Tax=Candida pseudojiufengensis TaxID=497109 RepID=UPI0022252F62|nr:FRE7 [Candida pseudojiufengensis]KAI5960817.1 FRE7 [Candida pseudojiufengensis]